MPFIHPSTHANQEKSHPACPCSSRVHDIALSRRPNTASELVALSMETKPEPSAVPSAIVAQPLPDAQRKNRKIGAVASLSTSGGAAPPAISHSPGDEALSADVSVSSQLSAGDINSASHRPPPVGEPAPVDAQPAQRSVSVSDLLDGVDVRFEEDGEERTAWSAFPESESSPFSAALHADKSTFLVHFVFGCNPLHSMIPDARLKLLNFIKQGLFARCIEAGRGAFLFRFPGTAFAADTASFERLTVPNIANFGRHSIRHSFFDDVFCCALEMHCLQLLPASDFAYHIFHSCDEVDADPKLTSSSHTSDGWALPPSLGKIHFIKSIRRSFAESAKWYSKTVMQAADCNSQHAVILMGGDISSIFVIKSAIEKGIVVFCIQHTGKLADCIADLKQMQRKSMQRSEMLATLMFTLRHVTAHDGSVDAADSNVWLYVSTAPLPVLQLLTHSNSTARREAARAVFLWHQRGNHVHRRVPLGSRAGCQRRICCIAVLRPCISAQRAHRLLPFAVPPPVRQVTTSIARAQRRGNVTRPLQHVL